jgi:hypothetical protein
MADSAVFDTCSAKPAVGKSPGDVVPVGAGDETPAVGKSPGDVNPAVGKSPAKAETASKQVKAIADSNRFMGCLLKFRVDDARFVTSIENTTVSGSSWQGFRRQLVFGSLLRQFPYIQ